MFTFKVFFGYLGQKFDFVTQFLRNGYQPNYTSFCKEFNNFVRNFPADVIPKC